jgi:hypothetical protein
MSPCTHPLAPAQDLYLAGGDCVECRGKMYSKSRFERLSGAAAANWWADRALPSPRKYNRTLPV